MYLTTTSPLQGSSGLILYSLFNLNPDRFIHMSKKNEYSFWGFNSSFDVHLMSDSYSIGVAKEKKEKIT